ncbi:MAG: general stress protein [Tepidisphaeraceae bacterium]
MATSNFDDVICPPERSGNTLVAAFEDRVEAEAAVDELERAGFKATDIGYAIRGSDAVRGGMITDAQGTKDGKGLAAGALTGGMVGGVLGALAALVIPGVGPVIAGGVLASFFGGAIAGTAVGGIYGAMRGLEVSEEEAKFYEQELHSGKAIVAVRADGARCSQAGEILRRHGGYDLQGRRVSPMETKGVFSQP